MTAIRRRLQDETKRIAGRAGMPPALRGVPAFQQISRLSAMVHCPGLHEALMTPEVVQVVSGLAGCTPAAIQPTQLLLSPPGQGDCTLDGLNWHVDLKSAADGLLPGIQAFFLIDDVASQGGATLALAGSHRLTPSVAAALRAALGGPRDRERRLRDLGIEIVEMCGRAGDVFLMDMRLLHTPSLNTTKQVRMMATSRCFLEPRP